MQLLDDVGFFETHHVLPEAGGMLDQPPRFLQALTIVRDEREIVAAIPRKGKVM